MCYDISFGVLGRIYWILYRADALLELIVKYGKYVHGTIKRNGKITRENIINNAFEYALRPSLNDCDKNGYDLWNIMKTNCCSPDRIMNL